MPEFHAEAPQAIVSEGLAQGPYVAARVEVEPMTLRKKGVDSTNAPHTPHPKLTMTLGLELLMASPAFHSDDSFPENRKNLNVFGQAP